MVGTSATEGWYHSGRPALPIRWVPVRDPQGQFESQALSCTGLTGEPLQSGEWFGRRWRREVA